MAIDRHGTAWVEYTDGRLFAVDTTNGSCKATAFKPGQVGFETFGMGYSLNGDGSKGETLYVSGVGLAALDTKTFDLDFKGSLTYGRTELTGLDKQLFAFSVESGVIAGLNKATGATEVTYRTSAVAERAAFAFAQWGGDFWVFTGDEHSIVTQYSPTEDKSDGGRAEHGDADRRRGLLDVRAHDEAAALIESHRRPRYAECTPPRQSEVINASNGLSRAVPCSRRGEGDPGDRAPERRHRARDTCVHLRLGPAPLPRPHARHARRA